MQTNLFTTVGEVVDALGGTGAVAELANVGSSAVSNWRKDGYFPDRASLHEKLRAELTARGLDALPELIRALRAA